jgi:NAD(P)-dependent dehydrogenase (short-subunit alcohol dehydrogenase family)
VKGAAIVAGSESVIGRATAIALARAGSVVAVLNRCARVLFRQLERATVSGMGKARVCKGKSSQGDRPEWGPLLDAVGEELTGDFMWMFEVELTNGSSLQAYKHIDTRRYVHLAPDGEAFVFEPPECYRSVPAADVLAAVFAPLPGLAGVTEEQIRASWEAVERLSRD